MTLPDDDQQDEGSGDGAGRRSGGQRAPSSLPLQYLDPDQRQMAVLLRMLGEAFPEGRDGGQLAAMRGGTVGGK